MLSNEATNPFQLRPDGPLCPAWSVWTHEPHGIRITVARATATITQSLAHGLKILLLYDVSTPLLTVAEISDRLNYSQSKTYRLVRTLVQYGLLQDQGRSAKYSLGLNVLRLGFLAQQRFSITTLARPFMEEARSASRETVFLIAMCGLKAIVLERVESEEPVRWSVTPPGQEIPLHCTAAGKVLMAHLPQEDWDDIIAKEGLRRYTANTITDIRELKDHLLGIRNTGHALSNQEFYEEERAAAAPVINGSGGVVGALAIAGPTYRIGKGRLRDLAKAVVHYAEKISEELGYAAKP